MHLSLLNFICQFITQSLRAVRQHCLNTSPVSVCAQQLQSSLAAMHYREKQKCARQTLSLFAFYLQSILHRSGYRNNNCTNEKIPAGKETILLHLLKNFSACSALVHITPQAGCSWSRAVSFRGLDMQGSTCSSWDVCSLQVWNVGSGKYGEELGEGFQPLKGLQESWRGTFIRGMEWLNKEKDLKLKEGRLN